MAEENLLSYPFFPDFSWTNKLFAKMQSWVCIIALKKTCLKFNKFKCIKPVKGSFVKVKIIWVIRKLYQNTLLGWNHGMDLAYYYTLSYLFEPLEAKSAAASMYYIEQRQLFLKKAVKTA